MNRAMLTARSLALGAGIGALAAVSNLYVSLRTGWSLPVMTTAALVGFTVARASSRSLDPREATILTACASAAGYMAGGGNAAALPALAMSSGRTPALLSVAALWIAIAILGTVAAPLFRRGTIDGRALAFPTASATAELTRVLSVEREGRASREAIVLGGAGAAAAGLSIAKNVAKWTDAIPLPGALGSRSLASLTFGVDPSLVLAGAGALMTVRTAVSTLAGGVVTYGIVVPMLLDRNVLPEASYRAAVAFMVWPSAALLVASAMTSLAFDVGAWRRDRRRRTKASDGPSPRPRPSASLVLLGALVLVALAMRITLGAGVRVLGVTLALSAGMSFVAARAMGETDLVPTKALTPLAQLVFGAFGDGIITTTMAPNVTSGVALHAADTLGSLKVAKATGEGARRVLVARSIGCVVGGLAVAVAYAVVVRDASTLPTKDLPVPGVLVWRSVAEASTRGLASLPSTIRAAIELAAALGVVLAVLERSLPERIGRWVPSPVGLGSGMVLPASNAIAIALGALTRRAVAGPRRPARDELAAAVASGLVAGESIVGVLWQAAVALGAVV